MTTPIFQYIYVTVWARDYTCAGLQTLGRLALVSCPDARLLDGGERGLGTRLGWPSL